MADFSTVFEALMDEVASRIEALAPVSKAEKRFRRQIEQARADQPIGEVGVAPRVFEFSRSAITTTVRFAGAGSVQYDVTVPIMIQYPDFDGWHSAAIQDAHSIYGDLATNASATTGVCLRALSLDPLFTFNPVGQDPQFVAQLLLQAHVEIDV